MKGIGELFKQASQMQSKMAEMQEELAQATVVGESGAGLVRITLNGKYESVSVSIDRDLVSEDVSMLEDLVAAAINDAGRKVEAMQKEKMASLAGGMGLPPGMKLPF